jgi:hypothetical protein
VLFLSVAAAMASGCGDPQFQDSGPPGNGRAVVSWTLNGAPLDAAACKTERITSMNVLVLSKLDTRLGTEFTNVACALDRYSMAMLPEGPVRIFVDAVNETKSGSCVRYSGRVDTTTTSQFSSTPIPVALQLVGACQ